MPQFIIVCGTGAGQVYRCTLCMYVRKTAAFLPFFDLLPSLPHPLPYNTPQTFLACTKSLEVSACNLDGEAHVTER